MPIESQNAAEGLEPEGIGELAQICLGTLIRDEKDGDLPGQGFHQGKEPGRGLPVMEWKMG
jgi:hypothetical protein